MPTLLSKHAKKRLHESVASAQGNNAQVPEALLDDFQFESVAAAQGRNAQVPAALLERHFHSDGPTTRDVFHRASSSQPFKIIVYNGPSGAPPSLSSTSAQLNSLNHNLRNNYLPGFPPIFTSASFPLRIFILNIHLPPFPPPSLVTRPAGATDASGNNTDARSRSHTLLQHQLTPPLPRPPLPLRPLRLPRYRKIHLPPPPHKQELLLFPALHLFNYSQTKKSQPSRLSCLICNDNSSPPMPNNFASFNNARRRTPRPLHQ